MEKSLMLQMIADKIAICQKCDLCKTRTNTVPGQGNVDTKIMFLGEGPGQNEDETGLPFVGKAGQLLDNIIKACGFKREDIFITNLVKCRPPNNRTPKAEELKSCRSYLDLQIKIINPKYIICLGSVAAQGLLNTEEKISYLRGRFFLYNNIKVLATYHPSYLLRGSEEEREFKKRAVWEDFQILLKEVSNGY